MEASFNGPDLKRSATNPWPLSNMNELELDLLAFELPRWGVVT